MVKTMNVDTLRRLTAQNNAGAGANVKSGRNISDIIAYRQLSDMPTSKELIIQVWV